MFFSGIVFFSFLLRLLKKKKTFKIHILEVILSDLLTVIKREILSVKL